MCSSAHGEEGAGNTYQTDYLRDHGAFPVEPEGVIFSFGVTSELWLLLSLWL